MATFGDYWLKLQKQNEPLNCDRNKVTLTVAEFRKRLELAFQEGVRQGLSTKSIFDTIFGKDRQ